MNKSINFDKPKILNPLMRYKAYKHKQILSIILTKIYDLN
jgi:hypothetical protein